MSNENKKIIIAEDKENSFKKNAAQFLQCKQGVEEALIKLGYKTESFYIQKDDLKDRAAIKEKIRENNFFCLFNLFDGFDNDSQSEIEFVKLLEELQVPFTGNSSSTLAICLDKYKTKNILKENDILVPRGIFVQDIQDIEKLDLKFPLFVKPCCEDASLGIDRDSLVEQRDDLYEIVGERLREFPKGLLLEEFVFGKEFSAGFIGNGPYELLDISVLDYSRYKRLTPFLTHDSKWNTASEEFKKLVPSLDEKIEGDLRKRIVEVSKKAAKILECRSYFRLDFRERNNDLFVIDVNPNPDIGPDSGFMKQAFSKGYTCGETIQKIIETVIPGER